MENKIIPLTNDEIKIIKEKYEKGFTKFKTTSIIAPILGICALFAPPEFWNFIKIFDKKKNIRNLEDVTEPMYQSPIMILIVLLFISLTIALVYFGFVKNYKKDLNEKVKLRGEFKVKRVENLSRKVAENLDGLDTVLHFEENNLKVKKHLFKKSKNPDFLNSKKIIIEQSKYSRTVFLEEIVS